MRDYVFSFITLLCIFTECNCDFEPFVVGGAYVKIRNYPHAVYLAVECRLRWICGASILNQRVLMTAAHCLDGCNLAHKSHRIEAYAGHENLEKVKTTRPVKYYAVHNHYDEATVANDIGLAVVQKSFPLGRFIKRVIITKKFSRHVRKGVVAGWGIIDEFTEEETMLLKSVSQKIRSEHICAQIGQLHRGMFCAGSTNTVSQHPTRGDSGSALITSRYEEIGLVSFRVNKLPALMVYTNVSYYYDWIKRHAKLLYCKATGK